MDILLYPGIIEIFWYLSVQFNAAISSKRFYEKIIKTTDTLALNEPPSFISQTVKMVIANLVPRPPQRITQAILDHRTIVLLI